MNSIPTPAFGTSSSPSVGAEVGRVRFTESCWEWTGAKGSSWSHGQFRRDGKLVYAHREAWRFWYGPIPKGMQVLHRCDNPPCVRPDHLFLGTQRDNMLDCQAKGRLVIGSRKGEDHPRARLTDRQVTALRAQYDAGASVASLSREWGLSYCHTYNLARRKVRA